MIKVKISIKMKTNSISSHILNSSHTCKDSNVELKGFLLRFKELSVRISEKFHINSFKHI